MTSFHHHRYYTANPPLRQATQINIRYSSDNPAFGGRQPTGGLRLVLQNPVLNSICEFHPGRVLGLAGGMGIRPTAKNFHVWQGKIVLSRREKARCSFIQLFLQKMVHRSARTGKRAYRPEMENVHKSFIASLKTVHHFSSLSGMIILVRIPKAIPKLLLSSLSFPSIYPADSPAER